MNSTGQYYTLWRKMMNTMLYGRGWSAQYFIGDRPDKQRIPTAGVSTVTMGEDKLIFLIILTQNDFMAKQTMNRAAHV